jgi:hypothetical protein
MELEVTVLSHVLILFLPGIYMTSMKQDIFDPMDKGCQGRKRRVCQANRQGASSCVGWESRVGSRELQMYQAA